MTKQLNYEKASKEEKRLMVEFYMNEIVKMLTKRELTQSEINKKFRYLDKGYMKMIRKALLKLRKEKIIIIKALRKSTRGPRTLVYFLPEFAGIVKKEWGVAYFDETDK